MRHQRADHLVVVKKRSNVRGAKGWAIHVEIEMGQLATGGARWFRRRAAVLIEWHEPCDGRLSRTVPWEPGGEIPPGDPTVPRTREVT